MPASYLFFNGAVTAKASTIDTSAGAGDANKIVSTDSSGYLTTNIIKGVSTSTGAPDAGKPVVTNASGAIDPTFLAGIGADTAIILASESLGAGNLVSVWDNAGTPNVRKADASGGTSKDADGYVLSSVTGGSNATVYFSQRNTSLSGLTPGAEYFLSATPGAITLTPPSTPGFLIQSVGTAVSATSLQFDREGLKILN
jgi:hypothetical protein